MACVWNIWQWRLVLGDTALSLFLCFKKLGFSNTLIRNTIKKLSKSSMECYFCIWLARNKGWTPSAANCMLNDPSKETFNSPFSLSSPKQTTKSVSNRKSILANRKSTHPVGLINKGNTCCSNSVFQILSVTLNFWSRVPLESNTLLPKLQAISINMAVKQIQPNLLTHLTFYGT